VRNDALNPLRILNPTLTLSRSKTWMRFPTPNLSKPSQTNTINHRHLLFRRLNYSQAAELRWGISLLNQGNATLSVALRWTYETIPTARSRCVVSPTLSRVGSRRMTWIHTMTTCWTKETPLCISQASKTAIVSRSSWITCQMIRLSGSGNYTLSTIWDWMTITNALSNTWVMTSSKAWDGWCGSQPTPSISFMPVSIAVTAIHNRNASIPQCTLRTGGGRHM